MRQIFEKNMRILTNLLTYCHELGGESFTVDLKPGAEHSRIHIQAKVPALSPKDLEELIDTLKISRQPDLEQNYWYLGGESELGANLTLVAAMTDHSKVIYENETLSIELMRQEL